MNNTSAERTLASLRASLGAGNTLVAVAAGSGLVARAAESAGADLIAVYSSGRFRRAGLGSLSAMLPFGNANNIVAELLPEVLGAVSTVPVVAGVCATDPFLAIDAYVRSLSELGVCGVQNFPTVGLYDGHFREDLEATGISFEREVELMRAARRAGLLACAFVTDVPSAQRMALAGVDVLVPLLGVTRTRDASATLEETSSVVQRMAEAAQAIRDDVLVMFHGGPVETSDDVQAVLKRAPSAVGYFAASSIERSPVFEAVREATTAFKGPPRDSTWDRDVAPDFNLPPPPLPIELTVETLGSYLRSHNAVPVGDPVEVEELSGGLSNVVLRWRCRGQTGVVKQSRPRLRVQEEWLSDVRRILNERDAMLTLRSRLGGDSVPEVTFSDAETFAFGMTAISDDAPLWKDELLAGHLDPRRADEAGRLLRQIHDSTRGDAALASRFTALPLLDQNRLDPWYRAAATAHPDLRVVFEYAIERLLTVEEVLVHGDFVPKNIFLVEGGLVLLDYEVAHYGNAGYDVATFINHMFLKGFRLAEHRRGFCELAEAMWAAYREEMETSRASFIEEEALLQLGVLMLARIDGKSKVEYLVGQPGAEQARSFGRWVLRHRPVSFRRVFEHYVSA